MNFPLERAPILPLWTIAGAAVVFIVSIAGLEFLGQAGGVEAHAKQNAVSWARMYEGAMEASSAGLEPLVIVGSSRAQLGIDPAVLAEQSGVATYQLAINGGNPMPVLERLRDDGFVGNILVSYMSRRMFSSDLKGRANTARFIAELDNPSPLRDVEYTLTQTAETWFRTRSSQMQLLTLLNGFARGELPEPPARTTRADRMLLTDTDRVDGEALEPRWREAVTRYPRYEGDSLTSALTEIRALDVALRDAGNHVLWARFPSTRTVYDEETHVFPRREYFERLNVGSRTHFQDDPRTRGLRCFDGSHLHPDDATALTSVLAEQVLPPAE